MKRIWNRLFLKERPSISFSFFRIIVALTMGSVVIPTLFNLPDNYYSTAYKTFNFYFFTPEIIQLVQKSSDQMVLGFVILFCVSWFFFLIGLLSQLSCIVMTFTCYYFYALNSFHVGTLSWDILLVTMFLMCVTPYHGDYFSMDSFLRGDSQAYQRRRPYFLQRLLQLQIACTFFYTGLVKLVPGNWWEHNPLYYLVNYPHPGVTKYFLLKDYMALHPQLCYYLGLLIIMCELLLPFLLFIHKTRISAIYMGWVFLITLILTLDVPATFAFLFPFQLLLFINSDDIVRWIDQKRRYNQEAKQSLLIYDGNCQFCQNSVEKLKVMDLFSTLKMVPFQDSPDIKKLHPDLTAELANEQLHLIESNGKLYGGFHVFRRICFSMPMLYPMILVFYFPGAGVIGPLVYKFIARNRYLLMVSNACKNNSCFR